MYVKEWNDRHKRGSGKHAVAAFCFAKVRSDTVPTSGWSSVV